MDIHLEGATKFNASREDVFRQLTNPERILESIPDQVDARTIDGTRVEGHIAGPGTESEGPFKVEIPIQESRPESGAKVVITGTGARSSLKMRGRFDLMGDGPTWITWGVDAEVDGDIVALGHDGLKELANRRAEDLFGQIGRAVEAHS